ncbi:hypothetical protein DPMN_192975 [Dreissena polymorpha]|uniref:Uncharacterized protein n=1 Tax=Dreissena polymorpha TaxID=45954 RepID=A0A9D3Y2S3_DREPO|nr:hypothetical protein DPMN_192975 [Dreissena polymorpha]
MKKTEGRYRKQRVKKKKQMSVVTEADNSTRYPQIPPSKNATRSAEPEAGAFLVLSYKEKRDVKLNAGACEARSGKTVINALRSIATICNDFNDTCGHLI